MRQLKLQIHDLHIENIFRNYVSIKELQALMDPPPARSTVVNAIQRMRLDAKQLDDSERGTYVIYLPSAKQLWPERFPKDA